MERLKQRTAMAKQALNALQEVLAMPYSPIVRDAAIQRFEFTFEAIWKLTQLYLREKEGLEINSPKSVLRNCLQVGLLATESQVALALKMADDRNLTVHTYNEKLATQIFNNLKSYHDLMQQLFSNLSKNINSQ
jgi:nucleotidyltransferase substrate binding protein (TIGR01987 family)